MELTEEEFQKQLNAANYITRVKQKEWLEKAKKHIPVYSAEYLFYKNSSRLAEMMKVDPEKGFVYDPVVLCDGIEILMNILNTKDAKTTNISRLQALYANFATPEVRVHYLRIFAEYLELYPIIGKQMIKDLEEVGKTSTDPEFLELLDGRIRSVQNIMKIQSEGSGYQPE